MRAFSGTNVSWVENLFGGLSPACDFVDLMQNGFYTRPVGPLQGSFERRSCTSTTVSRHRIHRQTGSRSCFNSCLGAASGSDGLQIVPGLGR